MIAQFHRPVGQAIVALALASILGLLYARTRASDESTYFEKVALLRQIKQLDARWDSDVLKATMGLSANYDRLVDPPQELNRFEQQVEAIVQGEPGGESAAVAAGSEWLRRAIEQKTRLVEDFKSHNAVRRNSVDFLPTAADDVRDAAGQARGTGARLAPMLAQVDRVLLESMIYARVPSDEKAAEIVADLEVLAAGGARAPAVVRAALDVFALHVATVLREQPMVAWLLDDLAAVPTAARVDELDVLFASEQRAAAARARMDRIILLGFAAALAAMLIYATLRVVRGHALINRINDQLVASNASLERRVEERTRDLTGAKEHREQAFVALQGSEERYRTLVEGSPDAILIEQDGCVAFANGAAARLFRMPTTDMLLGRSLSTLIAPAGSAPAELGAHPSSVPEQHALLSDATTVDLAVTRQPLDYRGRPAIQVLARDISESKRLQKELRHLATHDALTGLPNRVLLMDRLNQSLAQAKRSSHSFVVAAIDLDRFKWVNDSFGHRAGDNLLRAIAERIGGAVRGVDTLARVGGDEFVLILHDTGNLDEAIRLLERIVKSVAEPVVLDNGIEVAISCSVGCSAFPEDGQDAEELLRAADAAMYRAKESGRNTLQIFNAELRSRATERASLESDLRHAIERGELRLHYQPQVDLRSGRISGVEALLRWHHPSRGAVSPGLFIPIAEASGLIISIGEWVLEQACRQAKAWRDAGLAPVRIAVNLSAKQLNRASVFDALGRCLTQNGLDPALIELELTESASMEDPRQTIPLLNRLKELGVGLAIDDFGTGYSNMQYLTRLPIDTLKLDGSFVRGITTNPSQLAIAEAIIMMAHRLELKVVAEMTETEGQVALLASLGCDSVQGYFFAAPMAADDCAKLLRVGAMPLPASLGPRDATRSLLVVDDDPVITTALASRLESDGFRVIVANRTEDAFELLARDRVGAVLSDHRMPGMSGVDFLGTVRRLYPATTRLIFSGHGDFDAALGAINRGAVHKFLEKPLQYQQLKEVLTQVFERQGTPVAQPA
jgi:diguanylate cyclase (GGDEF)-like protein/PAS domain S-box-containing protein